VVTKAEKVDAVVRIMERGSKVVLTDKFANVVWEKERDTQLQAWEVYVIGQALGEILGEVEYPANWRRLLQRKDCPKYMKDIVTRNVSAYYPKLSLPEEDNWVTFEQSVAKDTEEQED